MNEVEKLDPIGHRIKEAIAEYIEYGEPAKLEECLRLGEGLDWVPAHVDRARELREQRKREKAGAASFFNPATQPSVEQPQGIIDEFEAIDRYIASKASVAEPKAEPSKGTALVPAPVSAVVELEPDELTLMNERHAIIENVGGKTVIASWEISPLDPSKQKVEFGTKESLLLRYSNRLVWERSGSRSVPIGLGQWWLGHPERRQYRGILFRPGEPRTVNQCLNMWQGWAVEAKRGDWGMIRRHINEVIANGNSEYADYIIRWLAWSVQNPGKQAEVALVLIGSKGTGKGTFVRCLQRIFGAHAFQVTSRDEVIGKFNGHLQDCILFVADEAYWGGDKRCVGRLQGMITEPTLAIERKGIDIVQAKNCLHVLMLAEPGWVIPAGRYERRYAAFSVSNAMRGNRAYFKALHDQIEGAGASAMFYDLQRTDLGDWHPRDIEAVKKSAALQDQQIRTLPPLEQWYFMLLQEGVIPGALANRHNTAYTRSLIDDAKERMPRLRYDLSEVMLRNFLTDRDSLGVDIKKFRASIGNGWSFPPLDECREAWEQRYGPVAWDPDVLEWKKKQKASVDELLSRSL